MAYAFEKHGIYNFEFSILSEVPNEKVNRFLEGKTNALERTEEPIADLTEEFKEWLLDKFNKARTFGEHQ